MAEFHPEITPDFAEFIRQQKVFFVATAPHQGRVNVSPKGLDTFRCLGPHHVAYLDLTGAGSETAAHLLDNGRITFMFCGFDQKPMILRLYGTGRVVGRQDAEWNDYLSCFPALPGSRLIITAEIDMVQTSCGFGVPTCSDMQERPRLSDWAASVGYEKFQAYWRQKNGRSIDGLPTGQFKEPAITHDAASKMTDEEI
jgi:hypothetical protein